MIVVIPSNRSVDLGHLAPLIDSGARFVVVDDSEGSIRIDHPRFRVFDWGDRRRLLGDHERAIPRRNGACRDLGFVVAWKEADDDEIIVALDDDCVVEEADFAARVERVLSRDPRPEARVDGVHLNILDCYRNVPDQVFPRGFPYSARPGYTRCRFVPGAVGDVAFSLGLWREVFDVNAIDKIQGPGFSFPDAALHFESVLVPPGKLVSVCSMNMHFRRSVIPAVYQLPMHVEVMPNWVIDRYGDIWGGFILKTLLDKRDESMAAGGPMIRHLKDGNVQRNTWQEHLCHLVNDEFVDLLRESAERFGPASHVDMMAALTEEFARRAEDASPILGPYLVHLADAMRSWVAVLS